jgi:hypothetical protein
LGLRGSGKTTFLAALWHYLESAEVTDQLEIPQLQPDRDYLNSIRTNWLSVKPVGRTSLRSTTTVSLSLHDKLANSDIEISIPDLSGESFRLQWSTRKAPSTYVSFARNCTAAFIFIHPSLLKRTHALKAASEDSQIITEADSARIPSAPIWSAERSSTQVQLVDILQLLLRMREVAGQMRLAVIISAWDLVKARISPAGWLDSRLPLLSQFLRSNDDLFTSEVFGVSAQGGDLLEDRDRLLSNAVPSSRCHALQGDSLNVVSIAEPLRFLLDVARPNSLADHR